MGSFRLTPLIVGVAGSLICIIAAVLLFFLLVKPTIDQVTFQQGRVTADSAYLQPQGAQAIITAQKQLAAAKVQAASVRKQWNYVQTVKNPDIDVSNRFHAWQQWTSELEFDFAPRVQKFLSHTGVKPLTKVTAPVPTSDPNAVPTSLIAMPLGTISVFGSYNQVLNHVAAWNRFDRIVMVNNLALSGYSPFITGTYSATEYIFPRNGDSPGPLVPSPTGTAATTTAGAPGGPGIPGGPGGPPP